MQIILGSTSPRRVEILRFFTFPFKQMSPDFDEKTIFFQGDPLLYVETLARKKADSLASKNPQDLILTADTIVYLEGKVYNKPESKEEAVSFLNELSGKWHTVYTALALSCKGKQHVRVEETQILFNTLSKENIESYLNHINFLDKAGSYAIQDSGSLIVKKIKGCYYNVMGLPLNALRELLSLENIDLWEHIKKL